MIAAMIVAGYQRQIRPIAVSSATYSVQISTLTKTLSFSVFSDIRISTTPVIVKLMAGTDIFPLNLEITRPENV